MLPVEGLKVIARNVVTSEAGQKAVKQVGLAVTGAVVVVTGAVATRILNSKKVKLKAEFGRAKASAEFED